jgi:hypothetical protein
VASAEANRGGKGAAERAAASAKAVEKLRMSRMVQVRNARASLISARRLQELAAVPQGVSVFIAAGVRQAGDRATAAAKRKLADALDGARMEQPRASTRGQRMAALAAAAVESRSIL